MFGNRRSQRPHGEFIADGDVLSARDQARIKGIAGEVLALRSEMPQRFLSEEMEAVAQRELIGAGATQVAMSSGELPPATVAFTLVTA